MNPFLWGLGVVGLTFLAVLLLAAIEMWRDQ